MTNLLELTEWLVGDDRLAVGVKKHLRDVGFGFQLLMFNVEYLKLK